MKRSFLVSRFSLILAGIALGILARFILGAPKEDTGPRRTIDRDLLERPEIEIVLPILTPDRTAQFESPQHSIEKISAFARLSDANRSEAIGDLLKTINTEPSQSKRGWAIASLAGIGGRDIDELLLKIQSDEDQDRVVQTWAAAARVSLTNTVDGLIQIADLISEFPVLARPIGMKIIERMSREEGSLDSNKILAIIQQVPQLEESLASTAIAFGPEELTDVMIHSRAPEVRRAASRFLQAIAQQGDSETVAQSVMASLAFDRNAPVVPWEGGPLFLPEIQWSKDNSRELVGHLVRWYLWCDINDASPDQKHIHHIIRNLGLAQAAGYQPPHWNDADCLSWLMTWKAVVGKSEIEAILAEQGVEGNQEYSDVFKNPE